MADPKPDRPEVSVGDIANVSDSKINIAGGNIYQADTLIIANQVGEGLQAFRNLIEFSSPLREAATIFRSDFEKICSQVELLGDYKDLHDLLHQIQYHCYFPLLRERTRFPDDPLTIEIIDRYQADIKIILLKLQQVATAKRVPATDLRWIGEVDRIQNQLRTAIDQSDPALLDQVLMRMGRLLYNQPSMINVRLNSAAQLLPIDSLLEALLQIQEQTGNIELDPGQVNQFRDGLKALHELKTNLAGLVADHDQWQLVEMELHRIEDQILVSLVELQDFWPYVKELAEPLYCDRVEAWAELLRENAALLDQLLPGDNPTKVRQVFHRYRHEAGNHFFQVDLELKALCDELRRLGELLSAVMRRLK